MTTPTDSAMTASAVRDILERLDYASKSKTFGSDDEASMVRVAHRVIRALTADLARVEGERDGCREKCTGAFVADTKALDQLITERDALRADNARLIDEKMPWVERALAAEAKSARLMQTLREIETRAQAISFADSIVEMARAAFAKERADNLTGERKPDPRASK